MIQLKVERLPSKESGHNLVYIDPSVLLQNQIEENIVVELRTKRGRRLLARVAPRPQDEGRECLRLDRYQFQLLKPDLREKITVTPIQVEEAKRLVLEPMAPLDENLSAVERELWRRFAEEKQLACSGMLLSVKLPTFSRGVLFRVISVDPERAVIGEGTRVSLRTSSLRPGIAANLVTFDDVGGLKEEIEQIRELVECPLRFPQVYESLGIEAPHGILLHGPPGAGKTYLIKAIANEIGAHFLYINGPEIVSSVHGGTEANLRRVFEEAMEHSPSVVMIDELDAIAPQRAESDSQADVRMGTQLLSLMDGLINMEDVVVIGTTNRLDSLDPALRRPGRLDREIFIGPPDMEGRLEILNIHTRCVPLDEEGIVFLPEVARMTHGYVGADLMELVRQAGLNALRRVVGPGFLGLHETDGNVEQIVVQKDDFLKAMQKTGPSAMRETLLSVSDVSWKNIGGLEEVIQQLREAVEMPLLYPEAFDRLHIRPSNGILLYGPPGTGKTMIAKALAHECGVNFIPINGPQIFSKWLGKSEETIRSIFQLARQVAPAIIFFDQVDAIAARRRGDATNATTERVVNQLLTEMDGFLTASQIIVVAATNHRELIDPAFLRPGRLGLELYVGLPNLKGRQDILRILLANLPLDKKTVWNSLVQKIAKKTEGFSGADLSAVCERAKMLLLREGEYKKDTPLAGSHFTAALKHILQQRASIEKTVSMTKEPDERD